MGTPWDWISKEVGKIPGVSDLPSMQQVGSDIWGFLKNQQVPGTQVTGAKKFGDPNAISGLGQATGIGSSGSKPPATTDPTTTQPAGASPYNALTQGLGMFYSQYLAPLMAQQNKQNQGETAAWGQAMNQALQNPLPAGMKSQLQASDQQLMGDMQLQDKAASAQALGAPYFQQLMGNLQASTAAQQALADAFTKAVTYYELGVGSPTNLSNLLQGQLSGTSAGALASLLGSGSTTNPSTGQTPTTSPTPAINPTSNPASVLPPAVNAALTAGAGYTPPTSTGG